MPNPSNRTLNKSNKVRSLKVRRKIAMLEVGITAADIAREAGVSRQAVSLVIADKGKSENIEVVMARMTGVAREELFPVPEPVAAAS